MTPVGKTGVNAPPGQGGVPPGQASIPPTKEAAVEASGAPPTPTLDSLKNEIQALAQHAAEVFQNDPRVAAIQEKIEAVREAVAATEADEAPDEEPEA